VKWPARGVPGAHSGAGAGLRQVDRRQAAGVMTLAVARKVALVRAQPISLGCEPSPTKPSIDQVLTNSPSCLGLPETCARAPSGASWSPAQA